MKNGDHIRSMTDEELAAFLETMLDEYQVPDIACWKCINYGTHHWKNRDSDPTCGECECKDIGIDTVKWLQSDIDIL